MEQKGEARVRVSLSFCTTLIDTSFLGVIFSTFQGELRMETQQVLVRSNARESEKPLFDIDRGLSCQFYVKSARR